jgi:hypothetical protein
MSEKFTIGESTRERFKVTETTLKQIQAIGDYDLSQITDALNDDLIRTGRAYSCEQAYPLIVRFGKADKRLAQRLEDEFKRFCILTLLKPGVPHAPAGAVDMYWHFFILHTIQYVEFCEQTWGDFRGDPRFRDHFPSTNETRQGMLNAYKLTRDMYVEVFGEPKDHELDAIPGVADKVPARAIWEAVSDTSGDSYSGIVNPNEH